MKREAKERQGERNDLKANIGANLSQCSDKKRNPKTSQIVAGKIGVSENTYRNMKQIVSEGTPEQI